MCEEKVAQIDVLHISSLITFLIPSEFVLLSCNYQSFVDTEPPIAVASRPSKRVPVNCMFSTTQPTPSNEFDLIFQLRYGRLFERCHGLQLLSPTPKMIPGSNFLRVFRHVMHSVSLPDDLP